MIELPEALTLAEQVNETLPGKTVTAVFNATKLHRFTFFYNDPSKYAEMLVGKKVLSAKGYGMFVDVFFTGNAILSIGDGINMRYRKADEKVPDNYQLLIVFDDESYLVFTVSMYGMIGVYLNEVIENIYHKISAESISPLDDEYTEEVYNTLFEDAKKTMSAKAFLATKQRIPGVGNGVAQDILFNAKINPKRKVSTFTDSQKKDLYQSLKNTLKAMASQGGRDTQSDMWGNSGRYKTILSANTWTEPCIRCGGKIVKESYMGGTIYYCKDCQM